MKIKEVKELENGLYKVYWTEGGHSLAAIGRLYNGDPWFAPTNWTSKQSTGIAVSGYKFWNKVKSVKLIKGEYIQNDSPGESFW